jgi:2-haloacid dehalogenase
MTKAAREIVVFDLGGVLIDWDPRHLYRKLFAGNEVAMEHFLASVCTHEWNCGQDAGRTFAEGTRLLKAEHPDKAELIDAYCARFDEMMPGPIAGSVEILADLKSLGAPLYCLTNFSAETYPPTFERFEFLRWFRGVLVSGEVGIIKPTPAFSNCYSSALQSIRNAPSISTTSPRMWTLRVRSGFTRSISRHPPPCAPSSPNSGCFPRNPRYLRDENDRGID